MELEIYSKEGRLRTVLSPDEGSQHHAEIGGDDYLSIQATGHAAVSLEVGDYADFDGERYWCIEGYTPKEESTKCWKYTLQLYGSSSLIGRCLVLNPEGTPVFALTAPAREHVALIVENLNRWDDHGTNWKVGEVVGTENLVIDYSSGLYANEALKKVAEEAKSEWWIEGETVNVCKCERGEPVVLGYGKGLRQIERQRADNVKFFTRLFPIGSSRNIDAEKYGASRLHLPSGAQYVEKLTEWGIIEHYEQSAFQDIYPRRIGEVSSVRSEEAKGDDGNPFTIYYFKDNGLTFDPNDYEIADLVKHVTFQDGELAGRDFEVNFNSKTREFEIITTWPYDDGTQLPGGALVPKGRIGSTSGDKYVLWNIRMPDEYYPLAEKELASAASVFMEEHCQDVSVYKAPTDYVYIDAHAVPLRIGQHVRLESSEFFPVKGYVESRITSVSRRLVRPGDGDIEISDVLSQTSQQKLQDSIEDVRTEVRTGRVTFPDIIRSWDDTMATDTNLYSARRTHQEFLSKKRNDRAKGKIIFEQGIVTGADEDGTDGGSIDKWGNAELLTLVVRSLLGSPDFADGFDGKGWRLWLEEGLSHLTIDKLTVRQVMTVFELLVEKIRSVGGQIVVSAANGKIKTVEEVDGYYKVTFEQENTFEKHDLMRCQTFTGGALKSYWVEVADADSDSVLVSKEEFEGWSGVPAAADEVVLMGNTEEDLRQNLILLSATEDGQPRMDVLDGVKGKTFADCLRVRLGNLDGIRDDWFPADKQPQGNGLYADNAYLRGTFLLTTGEDVKTKFEIAEGKVESAISALRQDFATDKGFLNNPSFDEGLSKWMTENETVFWLVGNKWIWANQNVLTKKGDGASVTKDDGRVVVRIKNKYITQKNANLKAVPQMTTNGEGQKEALPVYLSFFYRCAEGGQLKIAFENVDKTGFANFNSFHVEETLEATDGYKQYNCNGLWNGTGDFKLSFTGDIYLYMLILSMDKIESLTYKYRTLFEQSEKLVKIAAQNFDQDGNVLAESGIMVKATGTGIYAQGPDGKLALIGVGVEESYTDADGKEQTRTVIKLTADNIKLEGLVTANGYFKVKTDGSIEAVNGTFRGKVHAESGYIGGFIISNDHIGVGSVSYEKDEQGEEQMVVKDDTNGLFLYDSMIGFNAKDRQAIFGTWRSFGQPMLVRLVDTATPFEYDGKKYDLLPKYGIVFDIRNSDSANLAFCGTGNGGLNGFVDGYRFQKVNVSEANIIYDVSVKESNRLIVSCNVSNSGIALPRLSSVRRALGIGSSTPFAFRLIISSDLGSSDFVIYGRNQKKNSKNETPWDKEDYPLFTHWNGGRWDSLAMGQGDTVEVLLVYDPERTTTIDGFTTQYTARTINRQD